MRAAADLLDLNSPIAGALAGWLTLAGALGRSSQRRPAKRTGALLDIAAVAVMVFGASHAWSLGSDVRNPVAVGIGVLAVITISATAVLVLRAEREPPIVPLDPLPVTPTQGSSERPPPPSHRDLNQGPRG